MPGLSGLPALPKTSGFADPAGFPLVRIKIGIAAFGEKDFVSRSSCL
jgi:hypothetical protein